MVEVLELKNSRVSSTKAAHSRPVERGLADPKRVLNRWVNGVLGVVYAIVTALTFRGSPLFYQMVVVLEIALASLIVRYAFRWPRHSASVR